MTDERTAVVADAIRRNVRRLRPGYGDKVVEEVVEASVAGVMRGPNASMVRGSFNNLLDDVIALRAENERLRAENASLKEANEIDLGEKAPLIFENTELRAKVSELTRLLGDAEEAIATLAPPGEEDRWFNLDNFDLDAWYRREAVQRALKGASL